MRCYLEMIQAVIYSISHASANASEARYLLKGVTLVSRVKGNIRVHAKRFLCYRDQLNLQLLGLSDSDTNSLKLATLFYFKALLAVQGYI